MNKSKICLSLYNSWSLLDKQSDYRGSDLKGCTVLRFLMRLRGRTNCDSGNAMATSNLQCQCIFKFPIICDLNEIINSSL